MTSVTGPRVDPVPLFDLVTGFPPDDAVDVTVPMPLSLAVYMTMLESTGHSAELATLRKLQMHERLAALGHDELPCRGPWPRHQIVAGRRRSRHG